MLQKSLLIFFLEIQLILEVQFIGFGLAIPRYMLSYDNLSFWASLHEYFLIFHCLHKEVPWSYKGSLHISNHIQAINKDKSALKFGEMQEFIFYCLVWG